jgi:hypothetical protein
VGKFQIAHAAVQFDTVANFYFQTTTTKVPLLIGVYCCIAICSSRRATIAVSLQVSVAAQPSSGKSTLNMKEGSAKVDVCAFYTQTVGVFDYVQKCVCYTITKCTVSMVSCVAVMCVYLGVVCTNDNQHDDT